MGATRLLATHDLCRAFDFYRALGLRELHEPQSDDVMVDDLDALHATLTESGIGPSPISRGGHNAFTFRDPDGYVVTVNDSHVSGTV